MTILIVNARQPPSGNHAAKGPSSVSLLGDTTNPLMGYASLFGRDVVHAGYAGSGVDMDDPSRQLQDNLGDAVKAALLSRRPILTHLNADTSWLLQLPYPTDAVKPAGRTRYNILIDPW